MTSAVTSFSGFSLFNPLLKDVLSVALVWAVAAKIFGFESAFPLIVFCITLPFAIAYLFGKSESVQGGSKTSLNEAESRFMNYVNRKTNPGVARMVANKFATSFLQQNVISFLEYEQKVCLTFDKERYHYVDKKWIVIPSKVVFSLFPTGEIQFDPISSPKEITYTLFFHRQVKLWDKVYPGREGTFTVSTHSLSKDNIQYRYKDLL